MSMRNEGHHSKTNSLKIELQINVFQHKSKRTIDRASFSNLNA